MSVSYHLDEAGINVLAQCVLMLGKMGDSVTWECREETIVLRVVRSSQTSFMKIAFSAEAFSKREFPTTFRNQCRKYKIHTKSLLLPFKTFSKAETLRIELRPNRESIHLLFNHKGGGLEKEYILHSEDCEILYVRSDTSRVQRRFRIPGNSLNQSLRDFEGGGRDEVCMVLHDDKLEMITNVLPDDERKDYMRTCVTLQGGDILMSKISGQEKRISTPFSHEEEDLLSDEASVVSFSVEDVLPFSRLCGAIGVDVDCFISEPGMPITFSCSLPTTGWMAELIVATLSEDNDDRSTQLEASLHTRNQLSDASASASEVSEQQQQQHTREDDSRGALTSHHTDDVSTASVSHTVRLESSSQDPESSSPSVRFPHPIRPGIAFASSSSADEDDEEVGTEERRLRHLLRGNITSARISDNSSYTRDPITATSYDFDRQKRSGSGARVIVQTPFSEEDACSSGIPVDPVSDHLNPALAPSETGIVPATLTGDIRRRALPNAIDTMEEEDEGNDEDSEGDESDQFVEATPVPASRRRKKL